MSPLQKHKKIIIIICIALLLIVGVIIIYAKSHSASSSNTSQTAPTASQATKGETEQQAQNPSNSTNSSNSSTGGAGTSDTATPPSDTNSDKSGGGVATSINPPDIAAPTGTFVSNHSPNLSGSPAPNTEQSVCNTTSGATCQITFTNGSVTKSLSAQVTDHSGAAYWNWKIQDLGLTAGTWKVQAKATYDTQTKTTDDAMNLVVKQ